MKNKTKVVFGISAAILLTVVAVQVGRGPSDNTCANEGQAAVEAFLRTGAGGAITNYGTFQRLEGSGFSYPGWNIQGYHYLTLDRTAFYSDGALPIRIYVTEGRVTAPKLKTVGISRINLDRVTGSRVRNVDRSTDATLSQPVGVSIFVSHPGLK